MNNRPYKTHREIRNARIVSFVVALICVLIITTLAFRGFIWLLSQ